MTRLFIEITVEYFSINIKNRTYVSQLKGEKIRIGFSNLVLLFVLFACAHPVTSFIVFSLVSKIQVNLLI